ncbi:hypothetical protein CVIRNUC_000248 [Coccomyxa viridis]|uniref:Uncharacterized protein n=1 Tax=Coccomyxa viridis TaxID=1274662 RepID=A0AAV1HQG4_9CHLO|nr:hypothetical protein CVIRNUC_000248 [Coccomyxa viridis]
MQESFRGHNLSQAGVPTLTGPQSCHAASQMGCARISRKHKCQQAWYGCKESDLAEHPVMPQPDPGRDGYFLYRPHHHQMRSQGCTSCLTPAMIISMANVKERTAMAVCNRWQWVICT